VLHAQSMPSVLAYLPYSEKKNEEAYEATFQSVHLSVYLSMSVYMSVVSVPNIFNL
jgi:hypothetical protein